MLIFSLIFFSAFYTGYAQQGQWPTDKANAWYQNHSHLVGSNYIPSYAINQLEFWQANTFNQTRIDLELTWAQNLGYNTIRVFLHDLAWSQDPSGFKSRIDTFLGICNNRGIKPFFAVFDSCWNPEPKIGVQPAPTPGVHNPDYTRLESYVKDLIGTFANDQRVLFWDLWNEPDNGDNPPANKIDLINALMPQVFQWARSVNPIQPLTSGVWHYGSDDNYKPNPTEQIQLNNSDIVTFHDYGTGPGFEALIKALQKYGRPIVCSEYMARPQGSTFVGIMPIGKQYNVGMTNWGFVNGKTQTNFPWDSWQHPYTTWPPAEWFHDVLREDGTPYLVEEVLTIKHITGCPFGYPSKVNNWTCYNSYGNLLSWTDAQLACQQNYARLVSIDSVFENTDVLGYAKSANSNCDKFYIGLYNSKYYTSKDNFTWINYNEGTYRNWKSGSPTNDPTALCVVLNSNDGTWTNQPCSTPQCYICGY